MGPGETAVFHVYVSVDALSADSVVVMVTSALDDTIMQSVTLDTRAMRQVFVPFIATQP